MELVNSITTVLDENMHDPPNMRIVVGDILDIIGRCWVVHQCTCVYRRPGGLAKQISRRAPAANMYCIRDDPKYMQEFGSINIISKVINCYAQLLLGGPADGDHPPSVGMASAFKYIVDMHTDTRKARLAWFE